jgi:hypothetical protein
MRAGASRPRSAISNQADAVIPADRACRFRDGVDPSAGVERPRDVDPVVLGEGPEDPGVLRKVLLREARHDATRVWLGHADLHVIADRERATEPLVLDKPTRGGFDNHVHTEPAGVEAALWLEFAQPVKA